jgi:hypothetical protein
MNTNFDYGDFIIEYRTIAGGHLLFVKKRITDLDVALKECNRLKGLGYHDVLIKKVSLTPFWKIVLTGAIAPEDVNTLSPTY